MLKKMMFAIVIANCVFAYDAMKKTGPMPGVMINRKVAAAKQTFLNRQIAFEDGDKDVVAIQDDEVCVELKKNPFLNNTVNNDKYHTGKNLRGNRKWKYIHIY